MRLLYFWILFIILYYIFGYCLLYSWILNIQNIRKIFPSVPRLTRSSGAYSGDAGESGASRFFSQMHAKADLENESRLRACAAQRRSRRAHSELKHAVKHAGSLGMLVTGEFDRSSSSPNIICGHGSHHRFLLLRGIAS